MLMVVVGSDGDIGDGGENGGGVGSDGDGSDLILMSSSSRNI